MGVMPQLRFPEFNGKWAERQLDEIVDKKISYGIVQAGPNIPSGMPYIKSKDLNTPLIINELERTSNEIAKRYRRSEVSPGDIVFSLRGNIGVSQIVPAAISVANLTQGTARISVEKLAVNTFVFIVLETQNIRKRIFAVMKGSTFQEISLGDLRQIKICMPPVSEQKKIAEFLGVVDEKIRLLQSRHDQLTLYKKGVMQKIFAQDICFKADDGSDFPDWETSTLGNIATFTKGKGIAKADISEGGQTECIRYGQLYTDYNETIDRVISRTNVNVDELVLSDGNEVLIPASGETQIDIATASCVVREGIALGGDLNIVKTKQNGVFLSYYLNSAKKIEIARLSQGISVVHVYASQLASLSVNIPSLREQQKIADFLSAIDEKIEAVCAQIENMKSFKKGLLQQMFV